MRYEPRRCTRSEPSSTRQLDESAVVEIWSLHPSSRKPSSLPHTVYEAVRYVGWYRSRYCYIASISTSVLNTNCNFGVLACHHSCYISSANLCGIGKFPSSEEMAAYRRRFHHPSPRPKQRRPKLLVQVASCAGCGCVSGDSSEVSFTRVYKHGAMPNQVCRGTVIIT